MLDTKREPRKKKGEKNGGAKRVLGPPQSQVRAAVRARARAAMRMARQNPPNRFRPARIDGKRMIRYGMAILILILVLVMVRFLRMSALQTPTWRRDFGIDAAGAHGGEADATIEGLPRAPATISVVFGDTGMAQFVVNWCVSIYSLFF